MTLRDTPVNLLSKYRTLIVAIILAAITILLYIRVRGNDFVIFDDDEYVIENSHVSTGVTIDNLTWAFTSGLASNWHPLTWISHMLDCELFQLNPGGHHLTSVLFHVVNSLLLLLLFHRMTGRIWESAFIAAVFAVHPLHVESVAWISERKDVLSGFFWLLTIWLYVRYVSSSSLRNYLLVFFSFTLGLMAKPMLVTLPFVLLLLDYWPLGRHQISSSKERGTEVNFDGKSILYLAREKIPLFLLAIGSSIVTYLVQQHGGATSSFEVIPFASRLADGVAGYLTYLWKTIRPDDLAIIYPDPRFTFAHWQVILGLVVLVTVTSFCIRRMKQSPYLIVGWLWFLGTLVPVIGLVRVGIQFVADRYMYLPMIGLLIMVGWGASEIAAKRTLRVSIIGALGVLAVAYFWIVASAQIGYWKDSISLFEHTLDVTQGNYVIQNNLGVVLARQGRYQEAANHFAEALRLNPSYTAASENWRHAEDQQRMSTSTRELSEQVKLDPSSARAHFNLGNSLSQQGNESAAEEQFAAAVNLDSNFAEAHNNLASIYARQGKILQAIHHYSEAVRIKPALWNAQFNLGLALMQQGELDDAISHLGAALKERPHDPQIRAGLTQALQLREYQKSEGKAGAHR